MRSARLTGSKNPGTERQPSSRSCSPSACSMRGLTNASGLIAPFGNIHHQHALVDVHLRRRQADAGSVIHGLQEVVDERAHRVVHRVHRRRLGAQPRVGVMENGQEGHPRRSRFAVGGRMIAQTDAPARCCAASEGDSGGWREVVRGEAGEGGESRGIARYRYDRRRPTTCTARPSPRPNNRTDQSNKPGASSTTTCGPRGGRCKAATAWTSPRRWAWRWRKCPCRRRVGTPDYTLYRRPAKSGHRGGESARGASPAPRRRAPATPLVRMGGKSVMPARNPRFATASSPTGTRPTSPTAAIPFPAVGRCSTSHGPRPWRS